MAGGGVGEAMLIGAAVGAGTGGVMSAAQDKDVGEGMLLGALGGAATGGIGSQIGGAAAGALPGAATPAVETGLASAATDTLASTAANTAAENSLNAFAQQGANQAASSMASTPALSSTAANINTSAAGNLAAEGASQGAAGMGQGIFPGMSNANVAGATTTGGISGLMAANSQPAPYQAPGTETYNGPLSKFKMAGPSLSQYNYDPNSFQPSIAPGYAQGGIADLSNPNMYPQSQYQQTAFNMPSQTPISSNVLRSDYDSMPDGYQEVMMARGGIARYGNGGGIDFVRNLQPGGAFGDMTADLYGAQVETLPFLKDIEPGGLLGATTPGRLDYEDRKRKEEEEKIAKDRAMQEAKAAAMYNQMAGGRPQAGMARGGIADLGSYSDGGRLLRGPGDGMSDDIPASIAGKQPARLADGEFVVPADVVSHLGNGSTDAGAKTLYGMMDKVRKARTGSKKQGRDINPDKYMPKMAQGGIAALAEGGDASKEVVETVEVPQSGYNPSVYNPTTYNYSQYTQEHRPSGNAPQYYGDIYRGDTPDYSTPGYTLTGGNLGRWSNVAGEAARAAQPASLNQQVTQDYLQQLGRAPDQRGFNQYMQSGMTAPQIQQAIRYSPESYNIGNVNAQDYVRGLYQTQLGREAEQGGYDFWVNQLNKGATGDQIMRAFEGSPEYKGRHPSGPALKDPYAVQYTPQKPQTVRTKTVQDLIDESLAKYKSDYVPSRYTDQSQYMSLGEG